jgi:hypothetical protein
MFNIIHNQSAQGQLVNISTMRRLNEESKRTSDEMARLAKQTRVDAHTMKTIAAVTMLFLPGTFWGVRTPYHPFILISFLRLTHPDHLQHRFGQSRTDIVAAELHGLGRSLRSPHGIDDPHHLHRLVYPLPPLEAFAPSARRLFHDRKHASLWLRRSQHRKLREHSHDQSPTPKPPRAISRSHATDPITIGQQSSCEREVQDQPGRGPPARGAE